MVGSNSGDTKFKKWAESVPGRLSLSLAQALVVIALIIIIAGLIIMVTGNSSAINRLLDSGNAIWGGSPGSQAGWDEPWFWPMLRNLYPGWLVFFVAVGAIVPVTLLVGLIMMLSALGEWLIGVILGSFAISANNRNGQLFLTLIVWTIAIVITWCVINTDAAFGILISLIVAMIINLLLFWLTDVWNKWMTKRHES